MKRIACFVLVSALFACGSDEPPDIASVPENPNYKEHIRPFLADHCLLCHGKKPKNGAPKDFRLDVYADTDGKKGASTMAEAMADMVGRGKMPPDGVGVGPNARKMFRRWFEQGAPEAACAPSCEGKTCGDDGCGGSCGTCEQGLSCSAGACVSGCVPNCSGLLCGDDGCGGSCGTCSAGFACSSGDCFPEEDTEVTLAMVWEQVISQRCLSCHGTGDGGLTMGGSPATFHAATVGKNSSCGGMPYVVPGDPEGSFLLHKVEGRPSICGMRMPYGQAPLRGGQIATIWRWIHGGAKAD